MSSTTVRVSNTIRDKIRNISESHGVSIQDVIEKAINFYENKLFLEELNNAYAKD
ncbi:MAG: toxin-antitoxin system protein, partial [Candidatus Sericytochromatia bacterium]|nr:toxin-antitoxin system protein [Candidatus Sericytochromatia bacterium]